jgi:predicted lactoylglutathione lyase
MLKPAQNNILLELHVDDFEKVKEFYGKLGFKAVWERKPEAKKGYLIIKLDDNILCFWPGNEQVYNQSWFKKFPKDTKRGYGVEIVIMVKDVKKLYEKIKPFAKVADELQKQPWGLWDFRIEDPFGYYLRITEYHNILDGTTNSVK